ncbi:porin family protein [Hymenobacter sp. BT770]|uniref:porin family protein n=1 Tax=Hymenobacter sp. BT770 TaxID=2886942 RepID=UPI001D104E60|nr:porin family protein [Hymenobacter sp. BT770]MCC3154838.1 PorT family protein [Hymenobacter sp. BT770]MDO3416787.1 porin family protein [Hymenobacter sp. BT770]
MKKIITTLALLAGAAGVAQAQTNSIGITAGYGRTSLTGKNSNYNAKTHSAYQAGLMADVYVGEVVSFHPELLYTLQYYDATEGSSSSLDALSRDVSYINVPLLARYHADGLFFEAGPEVNFALAAKNEAGNDVKSDVSPVALDYVVGLGYQLSSGPSIGIRYDGGITNTYKDTAANGLGNGKLKNSTFWLNLGYSFGGTGR